MEKYYITLNNEELICLKQALHCLKHALSIAQTKLNYSAELAYGLKNSIMGDAYKKEEIKMEKLLDELNDLK